MSSTAAAGAGAGVAGAEAPALTVDALKAVLPKILSSIPEPWRGTTYKNDNLLLRGGFANRLSALIADKAASGGDVTTDDLLAVGNAEDYLRVSSNMSTTLEVSLGLVEGKLPVDHVFSFRSTKMPFVALALATGKPVHVYPGATDAPFTPAQSEQLKLIGATVVVHAATDEPAAAADGGIVVRARGHVVRRADDAVDVAGGVVDAVIAPNVLYIINPDRIDYKEVLVRRKRTATPLTTPAAEALLQALAGVAVTADNEPPTPEALAGFYAHLQTMSGTTADPAMNPVVNPAGLPALAALWIGLVTHGGADILMCSTAYGGSSQLVDVLSATTPTLRKHTFDIQGTTPIVESIQAALHRLAETRDRLMPTTVLFVEIPTNPDMKVPDLPAVAEMISGYTTATDRRVVLLVDATFAPGSGVMTKLEELVPDAPVLVFLSMSKSVSRGKTTAGTLIANHTPFARELLATVRETTELLDTFAAPDQLKTLADNHTGVEDRCKSAYANAVAAGDTLRAAVAAAADGYDMRLAFVTPEQAAMGFHTSTFSFNLPPPKGATPEVSAALAQDFVDLLAAHPKYVKPCVSFGQDNGLVYATVPATSTQGAIKEEDKAKQAVGGVQLVRLSFPPTIDRGAVCSLVRTSIETLYSRSA